MKKRYKKPILLILLCVILLMLSYVLNLIQKSAVLQVSNYSINTPLNEPICLVHLSDLHNVKFGEDNADIISLVAEQSPDLIMMTGDMINEDEKDISMMTDLIVSLKEIAPVYYGYGNHEAAWEKQWSDELRNSLEEAGAVVLEAEYEDIVVKNQKIRIGGLMSYYMQPGMMTSDPERKKSELIFAEQFEDTARYKILLNHIPTQWVDWKYIDTQNVDLVLSGHYHGGMIYFPWIERGLYAPYVGWFPENVKGVFNGKKAICVLSAGLGSQYKIPRINNNPEIVVIDLIPKNQQDK